MRLLSLTSRWHRFWHEPVRAERLALVRIGLALALLADQLLQYGPALQVLFGANGIAPSGLFSNATLEDWRWTVLVFDADAMQVVIPVYCLWVLVTIGLLVGWQTRCMNAAAWFLTICFINRTPIVKNGGDDLLATSLFWLMLMPSGAALSLDHWLQRRRCRTNVPFQPPCIHPWGVRVLQIQLTMVYVTSGIAKLSGGSVAFWEGTWWQGTSVYYVLNDIRMARISWVELPMAFWMTVVLTYASVWWEALFPLLLLSRRTRIIALWFGILFHLGIHLLIEVGWFSYYTLALYGLWVPDWFWQRFDRARPTLLQSDAGAVVSPILVGDTMP